MINITTQQQNAELTSIQKSLRQHLTNLQSTYSKATLLSTATHHNNQKLIHTLYDTISQTLKPLEYLLRFLTDTDLMNIASTCRSLYHIIYSPLGYRLCRHLRPIHIIKSLTLEQQIPTFTQTTLQQLCLDRNLAQADQDDKQAILITMKTNIYATYQKLTQLDLIIQTYDQHYQKLLKQIMNIGQKRQQQQQQLSIIHNQIQKLHQLLQESDGHSKSLTSQQQTIQNDHISKYQILNQQKSKLLRQKELLIKKIKNQQKDKQQGMTYAKEVTKVLIKLNQITTGVINNSIKK